MRNYKIELENRKNFIQKKLAEAHADGIVFGNSGGKDSALVGILCRAACQNTLGVIMPCASSRNYGSDASDAMEIAELYDFENRTVDLTPVRNLHEAALAEVTSLSDQALTNIAPRLRMTTLYAIAASENRLVAGTSNRSEIYMGYFTKWGDGASDFNPIADLTATEVVEFLDYLEAPAHIAHKPPSAGLFEGQTDEADMGISYEDIDRFLLTGEASEKNMAILERFHSRSEHKRKSISTYK